MKPTLPSSIILKTSLLWLVINLLSSANFLKAAPTPLPIPFSENFESGQWNVNFATSNSLISLVEITKKYGPVDQYHLLTHSVINGMSVTHHVDIHLSMTGATRDIYLTFLSKNLNPNTQPVATLWFSDNQGNHFTQLGNLLQASRFTSVQNWQNGWKRYRINLSSFIRPYGLNFTSHCVIRMVTQTQHRAPNGGIAFDNITVGEELVIETGQLPERTLYYALEEFEFLDITGCGRIECPPVFGFDEGLLDEGFWSLHEGNNGEALLEKNIKGYHILLKTLPNETGYAVTSAVLRFDATPWANPTYSGGNAVQTLQFTWSSVAQSLTSYDAIYLSDNGGDTYAKIFDFSKNMGTSGVWKETTLNLNEMMKKHGLKFSEKFVVVFQHFTSLKEGSPGYALDRVKVGAQSPGGNQGRLRSYNYPNPFSAGTHIAFELSGESDVLLKILDGQGKVIRTLTERNLVAGQHAWLWDGKDYGDKKVRPGIYFYVLETAQGVDFKRIWLKE